MNKKYIKSFNEPIKEEFDPMIGVDNFMNNTAMIALVTAWLLSGRYKPENIKSKLKYMKDDFLSYCSSMGYPMDSDSLDYKFNELVDKVKKIIKL